MSEQDRIVIRLANECGFKQQPKSMRVSCDLGQLEAFYQAATLKSAERIAALEGEVANLHLNIKTQEQLGYELQANNHDLRESFQNILDGNYPSPRTDRGKQCAHGKYYWEDCTNCIDDYIQTVLSTTPAESLAKHNDELIERCAKLCDPYTHGAWFANAIRALKGK